MHFGEVAANKVLFRLGKRDIQFSGVVFEINQLFKIRGNGLTLDFEEDYQ